MDSSRSFVRDNRECFVSAMIYALLLTTPNSVAEVTISIKNQGEEAYKPKEYGKSIVITRRFTKEGEIDFNPLMPFNIY